MNHPQANHTVRSFSLELQHLSDIITQMGRMAERQIEASTIAVAQYDGAMATKIVCADAELDAFERDVESEAVRVLALRQPMGTDLREVLAALKIADDLERIGDYAANIAKRVITLAQVATAKPALSLPRMGRLVQDIVKSVVDSYVERNVEKAVEAWNRDQELDDLYNSLFRETLTYMMEDPRNITACIHILFIAKNMERIGDHATNIAEKIHFLVNGTLIQGERPKSDVTSYTAVTATGGIVDTGRISH